MNNRQPRGRITDNQPKRKMIFGLDERCPTCRGSGKRVGHKELCGQCGGTGVYRKEIPDG